jgi:uncharacterized protein
MAVKTIEKEAGLYAATETNISLKQVSAVLELLLIEDCTVPFITRYRKEKTGGLDEEQIRNIQDSYDNHIEREKRREYILTTLEKMEVLTPEIKKSILEATSLNILEDIYAPFKSKKKTKGQLAVDAGLLDLADGILNQSLDLTALEDSKWLNPEKKFATSDEISKGVQSILIEKFSHDLEIKNTLRSDFWKTAKIIASPRKDAKEVKDWQKFQDYFEFEQPIALLKDPKATHRFLALRRGMTLKILKVEVSYETEDATSVIKKAYFPLDSHKNFDFLLQAATRAYNTSILPSLDLEIKTELKQYSDEAAIDVFGVNLKNLLLQPYLGAKTVLALDPGVRTGCKTVIVDSTGKLMFDSVIYPHQPKNDVAGSKVIIDRLVDHFNVEYVAVGDGTYGRETLAFLQDNIEAISSGKVKATLINEAGASIYSASALAKKEFPDKDATVRGAVSIARRFQDPLAELVKIDPKSIGVGQYQHDVNQSKLKKSLGGVVEDCVNFVGVDINTASAPLLSFVSGIGPSVAQNIVKTREEKGSFTKREELLKVSRYTQKTFEQSAGFLKIYNGPNPLDSSPIHPERYELLEVWAKNNKYSLSDLVNDQDVIHKLEVDTKFKDEVGEYTFEDIIKALKSPGKDPRTEFKSTEFRKDIKTIGDLKVNEWYTGIVTNITQFGAFVNIGIKSNGLVHVSEMADRFVSNALEVLKVGQEVKARVKEVDIERGRIALSLKSGDSAQKENVKRSTNTNSKGNGSRQSTPDVKIKNNAFAALKNFKIK